jgi:hypothetical protein
LRWFSRQYRQETQQTMTSPASSSNQAPIMITSLTSARITRLYNLCVLSYVFGDEGSKLTIVAMGCDLMWWTVVECRFNHLIHVLLSIYLVWEIHDSKSIQKQLFHTSCIIELSWFWGIRTSVRRLDEKLSHHWRRRYNDVFSIHYLIGWNSLDMSLHFIWILWQFDRPHNASNFRVLTLLSFNFCEILIVHLFFREWIADPNNLDW